MFILSRHDADSDDSGGAIAQLATLPRAGDSENMTAQLEPGGIGLIGGIDGTYAVTMVRTMVTD